MEADVILKMLEDSFRDRCFIIDVIISKYDSTMRAVLKHTSIGAWGQFLRLSKGKLDEEIIVPSLHADPYHRVEVFYEHIFYIVNYGKSQQCGCTKSDVLRLKKFWGYMINNNRFFFPEELRHASKVPLEHMFKNHDKCSA